ncbi:transporter suffix domain-containing protein [Skermania piniformis]|uniref:Transporter suffix domain-containing protein n=1 Tax=Skermania pinensis TaxID=39122 RepID=A0ABX8SAL6_9ACTN|nr:transporter suffix domain-containing protein [Skermania piniformis]QXQ14905.1 transporter suffix domain-containing protein [Skermania piniformis]
MLLRVGVSLILLSFIPWLTLVVAPLAGVSLASGAGLVAAAVVVAEIMFWSGLALAGKDTWQSVKANGLRRAPRELARILVVGRPAS